MKLESVFDAYRQGLLTINGFYVRIIMLMNNENLKEIKNFFNENFDEEDIDSFNEWVQDLYLGARFFSSSGNYVEINSEQKPILKKWLIEYNGYYPETEFTCPKCESHMFGSSNCQSNGDMTRHCRGQYEYGCKFKFHESEDDRYFDIIRFEKCEVDDE